MEHSWKPSIECIFQAFWMLKNNFFVVLWKKKNFVIPIPFDDFRTTDCLWVWAHIQWSAVAVCVQEICCLWSSLAFDQKFERASTKISCAKESNGVTSFFSVFGLGYNFRLSSANGSDFRCWFRFVNSMNKERERTISYGFICNITYESMFRMSF